MVTPRSLPLGALLALLLFSSSTDAQTRFRVAEPSLLVGDRAFPVAGVPLEQAPFEFAVLAVPGIGRYVVSDRPFDGARRAGQFSDRTLAFTVEGQSVRLESTTPILSSGDTRFAYVRFTSSRDRDAIGPAVLSLAAPDPPRFEATTGLAGPSPSAATRSDALGTETEALVATRREQARVARAVDEARAERDRLEDENARLAREVAALQSEIGTLDQSTQPLNADRDRLASEIAALQSERDAAIAERQRLAARRAQIDLERDALRRDLAQYTAELSTYEAERSRLAAERERLAAGLSGSRADRRALDTDLQTLEGERLRLVEEQARLDGSRQRLTVETDALETAVATLEAETTRLEAARDRLSGEQARLIRERDALVREQQRLMEEVAVLQQATNRLRRDTDRLSETRTALRQTATSAPAPTAPSAAQTDGRVDALTQERDALRAEAGRLQQELTRLEGEVRRLQTERDAALAQARRVTEQAAAERAALDRATTERLAAAERSVEEANRTAAEAGRAAQRNAARTAQRPTPTPTPGRLSERLERAETERDEYAVTTAALRREKQEIEARLRAIEEERDALLDDRAVLEADRYQLAEERDALHREAEELRTELLQHEGALPARPAAPARTRPTPRSAAPAVTPSERDGADVSLPAFDWSRLQNPEDIAERLRDTQYPQSARMARVEGDVLVLIVVDAQGRVTEATVAEPLGYGLDAEAERIVGAMRFVPARSNGQATTLRSQVVVRFDR